MTREEETELVKRICKGDRYSFEQFVTEYQSKVYSLALRMTGNEEDAFDISQDAFLKAYRSLPNFRFDSSVGSWLYRLTSNLCIDLLRKKKRTREEESVSLDDETRITVLTADDGSDPQKQAENDELRRAIQRDLKQLPEDQRLALILRDVDGLSYQEISDTLQLEIGTVKSRISRARAALAKLLIKDGTIQKKESSKASKGGEG